MKKNKSSQRTFLTTIPALFTALLAASCPVCWPAYALFLSSVGLGFMNKNEYLFEIVTTAVIITNVVMTWTGIMYKTFIPIFLTIIGSILILSGRFRVCLEMMYLFKNIC